MIDVLVHRENQKGNRVYMDFTRDPTGLPEKFSELSQECQEYLKRSGAAMARPIERLAHMNQPAIDLYKDHGIDLWRERLEVRVCAQHCCGGVAVDADWQTTIPHLYAVGEAAGNFGAYRPGGSALASGQTGALRAAEHIVFRPSEPVSLEMLEQDEEACLFVENICSVLSRPKRSMEVPQRREAQREMTRWAAHMRSGAEMARLLSDRTERLPEFFASAALSTERGLSQLLRDRDILLTQGAMLSAMVLAAQAMGSRGSGLVVDPDHPETFLPVREEFKEYCLITRYEHHAFLSALEKVRPLPDCDDWFETTWKEYRERRRLLL